MFDPHTILQNRYEIIRLVGRGGTGYVYQALDLTTGDHVALKLVAGVGEPESRIFRREVAMLSQLAHPCLPSVRDTFRLESGQCVVMDYVAGPNLGERLDARLEPFPVADVLQWTEQLVDVLNYLHGHMPPIIHRDLKPNNLKLTADNRMMLLDFGLAKGTVSTTSGIYSIAGYSPGYAPPEQVETARTTDVRSDVYALGATLYALLTSVRPPAALPRLLALAGDEPDPLVPAHELNPAVPPGLAALLQQCLAMEPDDRPVTIQAFAERLRRVLSGDESLAHDSTVPSSKTIHEGIAYGVPAQPTPLVGRTRERTRIATALDDPTVRLLTLTGPAGVGKTRLAICIVDELPARFPNGIFFVGLETIYDTELVLPEIATSLGIEYTSADGLIDVITASIHNQRMLLIVDNFEQIVDAGPLLTNLLNTCSNLKMLVTSREPLRLRWEHVMPVRPLGTGILLPKNSSDVADNDTVVDSDAVLLFLQSARAANLTFELTDDNASIVVEICRRLDGLPLAIELVAARIHSLTPREILAHLDERFSLLADGFRDVPERQRTLFAAIEWSYQLLTTAEQIVFRRMAVFSGGSTLDAIRHVCAAGNESIAVVQTVESLASKNLLQRWQPANSPLRFTMLQSIQAFAEWQMLALEELHRLQKRHLAYFLALTQQAEQAFQGAGLTAALSRIRAEIHNVRRALQTALGQQACTELFTMTTGLRRYFQTTNISEGIGWLQRALALHENVSCASDEQFARASNDLGVLTYMSGDDMTAAKTAFEAALALYRATGNAERTAAVLSNLAMVNHHQGYLELAETGYSEALSIYTGLNDQRGVATVVNKLGSLQRDQGNLMAARQRYAEARAHFRALNDVHSEARALFNVATLARLQGDYRLAEELLGQSVSLFRSVGDSLYVAQSLVEMGAAALGRQEHGMAATLLNEGIEMLEDLNNRRALASSRFQYARLALSRGQLDLAESMLQEIDAMATALGYRQLQAHIRLARAEIARDRNQIAAAAQEAAGAIDDLIAGSDWAALLEAARLMALLAYARQESERAVTLLGAVERWRSELGIRMQPAHTAPELDIHESARAQLGETMYAQALATGRSLSRAEYAALAAKI